MKTLLLAVAVLALSFTAGNADSSLPTRFGLAPLAANAATPASSDAVTTVPKLTIAPLPGSRVSTLPSSASEFAQLGTQSHPLPISPGVVVGLIALFVVAMRIMSVNRARAMAEIERDSHHGKAAMFRDLHAQRSER